MTELEEQKLASLWADAVLDLVCPWAGGLSLEIGPFLAVLPIQVSFSGNGEQMEPEEVS